MGTATRTRLLIAVFGISLCGLGLTASLPTLAQLTGPKTIIIDDGDTGFTSSNFEAPIEYSVGYKGDTAYVILSTKPAGTKAWAEWQFATLEAGTYDVYTTWGAHENRTKNASYVLVTNYGATKAVVNQTVAPSSLMLDGRGWQLLGSVDISGGKLIVTLTPGADSTTLADAVMTRKRMLSPSTPIAPTQTLSTSSTSATPVQMLGTPPTPAYPSVCGNAKTETGEQCDDGNVRPSDGCSNACQKEYCGDGIVTPSLGETCDAKQTSGQPSIGCNAQCSFMYCGDGFVQAELKEACDDSNRMSGDGCDALCQKEPMIICGYTAGNTYKCLEGTSTQCAGVGGKVYASNEACVAAGPQTSVTQPTVVDTCSTVTVTDGTWQNKTKPYDVNNDGVVNEADRNAVMDYVRTSSVAPTGTPITTAGSATYYNVDGSKDAATGVETITNLDVLLIAAYMKCATPAVVVDTCSTLASTNVAWQNKTKPYDVNNDGTVTQADAATVIAYLRSGASGILAGSPTTTPGTATYLNVDGSTVNGQETVTNIDAMHVLAYLRCSAQQTK